MRKFLRISGIVLGAVVLLGLLALAAAALVPFDPSVPRRATSPTSRCSGSTRKPASTSPMTATS
jgi:hypothetical protein